MTANQYKSTNSTQTKLVGRSCSLNGPSFNDTKTIKYEKQSDQLKAHRTFEYRKWFCAIHARHLFYFICSIRNGQIVGASITVTADCNARRFHDTDKFCDMSLVINIQAATLFFLCLRFYRE